MILIKELCKIEHLPTVLAGEVVCQRLQFMQHYILYVIVIKDWIKHKAIRIVLSPTCWSICLIEKSLAGGRCSKIHSLFSCAIRHHLSQLLHLRSSHKGTPLISRLLPLLVTRSDDSQGTLQTLLIICLKSCMNTRYSRTRYTNGFSSLMNWIPKVWRVKSSHGSECQR